MECAGSRSVSKPWKGWIYIVKDLKKKVNMKEEKNRGSRKETQITEKMMQVTWK